MRTLNINSSSYGCEGGPGRHSENGPTETPAMNRQVYTKKEWTKMAKVTEIEEEVRRKEIYLLKKILKSKKGGGGGERKKK